MRAPLTSQYAIAALSAIVLVVQVAATRLISATVGYHGSFAVIALVMLALAGSGASVYRDSERPESERLLLAARSAVVAGGFLAATALAYIGAGALLPPPGVSQVLHLGIAAVGLYASFHACGYAIAWLLASWSNDIGRMYFLDLAGAATGAFAAVAVLDSISPIQVLLASGLIVAIVGMLLAGRTREFRQRYSWLTLSLALITVATTAIPSLVRLRSAKLQDQASMLFERWNHLARVTVSPEIPGTTDAIRVLERTHAAADAEAEVRRWVAGWAMSEQWRAAVPRTLWIQLDSDAGTQIIERGGSRPLEELEWLRWDVTAAAYWLRPSDTRRAFVIGGGGGRDFLTALASGVEAVDVVELNPAVVQAVQETFADFSGRPYTRSGVHYTLGDARSELSRSSQRYDVIQMSMIDTWASSMTGALTLTENALYTKEAFRLYVEHLADSGMLSVSRWYSEDRYAETARVLSLMADALRRSGIDNIAEHIAVVFSPSRLGVGVATCILKRDAFTSGERAALVDMTRQTGFGVLWPDEPDLTVHHRMNIANVLASDSAGGASDPYDLSPPSDDRPFFFQTARLRRVADIANDRTRLIFIVLIVIILGVGAALVILPLMRIEATRLRPERFLLVQSPAEVTYFFAIGAAFMMVELSVVQRYIVFLGHPTYALTVVLFALLVSCAVGSLVIQSRPQWIRAVWPLLVCALAFTAIVVPHLLLAWQNWPLPGRIATAVALIVPLGTCMGTLLPSGMRALRSARLGRLVPWMWAVNGLAGTLSAVIGMFLAMQSGYTKLLITAAVAYAIAWVASSRFATFVPSHASRECGDASL